MQGKALARHFCLSMDEDEMVEWRERRGGAAWGSRGEGRGTSASATCHERSEGTKGGREGWKHKEEGVEGMT